MFIFHIFDFGKNIYISKSISYNSDTLYAHTENKIGHGLATFKTQYRIDI